jgi:hypothetical protein
LKSKKRAITTADRLAGTFDGEGVSQLEGAMGETLANRKIKDRTLRGSLGSLDEKQERNKNASKGNNDKDRWLCAGRRQMIRAMRTSVPSEMEM